MEWVIISTWEFSLHGCSLAVEKLRNGGSAMEALRILGMAVEDDSNEDTVGSGGFPNSEGEVQLDAACMDGQTLDLGAVAGLEGYPHPLEVAFRVMKDSPHNLLIGKGAEEFAARMGFTEAELLTDRTRREWALRRLELDNSMGKPGETAFGHDTVGIVAMDANGDMAAGTSTSGLAMKARGRVGDSPLVGSGFYVDNDVGGAAATGVGEDIMKGCLCFHAVELMRQGFSPDEAAVTAVRRLHTRLARSGKPVGLMAVICADNRGHSSAAANHDGFTCVVASSGREPVVHKVESCLRCTDA